LRRKTKRKHSALFRQADLLAKSLYPRIAANESKFGKCEGPADTHRTERRHALKSVQGSVPIGETGENQSLIEWVWSDSGSDFLSVLATARSRVGVAEIAAISAIASFDENLDSFLDSPLP
jgi:hypothetical protein